MGFCQDVTLMSVIKKNFTANFVGKIWTTAMSFIFLPYYIKLIGFEAYGLVGIYTALLALSSICDLGLGSSMTREMARLSSQPTDPRDFRNLTRTLEVIYWSTGAFMAACIVFAAPFISEHWVNAKELPKETIRQGIYCMGIALGFLWPSFLYTGGLMGLQKQVSINAINVAVATVRGVGMILILRYVSSTVQTFFMWQIITNLVQTALTAIVLWKSLPKSAAASKFDRKILGRLKGYAMGIAGIAVLGMICVQLDKMLLSRILSLDMFGYYTLASSIAWALSHISVPIYSVFFPHYSQLISLNDNDRINHAYHVSCQWMSALIIPTALFVVFFSSELILIWTQSAEIVQKTTLLVKLLMTGMLFNALSLLPTALQYAYGWTKLSFYLNLFNLIVMFPLMYWSAHRFGAEGVAWMWIAMNLFFLVASIQIMHRRIVKHEKLRWIGQDVGLPLLMTLAVVTTGRLCFPKGELNLVSSLVLLGVIYALSLAASILVSPHARRRSFSKTIEVKG
jgi:O-antigen/teichoic acid export membrane protein